MEDERIVGISNSPFISVPGTYKLTLIDQKLFGLFCIDEQGALRPHAVRHEGAQRHLAALLGFEVPSPAPAPPPTRPLPPPVPSLPPLERGWESMVGLRPVQGQAARGVEQGPDAQYEYFILTRM